MERTDHDGNHPLAMLYLWLERERYDRVVEEAGRLLADDPENPDLHRHLGIAWLILHNKAKAEFHLTESLRLNPEEDGRQVLLALLRAPRFGSRSSDKNALNALASDPDSIVAWQALGHSSLVDDGEISKFCARRILEIDPGNVQARLLMYHAVVHDETKPRSRQEAESWLFSALQQAPGDAGLHAQMGLHLLGEADRKKEGLSLLQTAVSMAPTSPAADHWRTVIAMKRDPLLRLLNLPKKTCLGAMFFTSRAIGRYPLLILLGKFFLILVILCLMGLLLWLVFLWPVRLFHLAYVTHGDSMRTRLLLGRTPWLGHLVPRQAWLRYPPVLVMIPLWFAAVPVLAGAVARIHPDLHAGNLFVISLALLMAAAVALLVWLEIRKRSRRKLMRGLMTPG